MDRVTERQVGVDGKQNAGGRDGSSAGAVREQDWRWNTLRPADLFPGWLTRSPGGFAFVSPVGAQQAKIPMPQSAMEG